MLPKIFVFLFLIYGTLHSQTILWESEYNINVDAHNARFPLILDSDSNLVSFIDVNYNPYNMFPYFIKYDNQGNILTHKQLFNGHVLKTACLYETDNGYNVFAATDSSIVWSSWDKVLPLIMKLNKDGDILDSIYPYDIYSINNYKENSFYIEDFCNNTLTFNKKFYNAFIKSSIPIDSTHSLKQNHVILTCFDSSGKIQWRSGFDTLKGGFDNYILRKFRSTCKGTILILLQYNKFTDKPDDKYHIKFIEADLEGNKIYGNDYILSGKQIYPIDIECFNDGTYVILGRYITQDQNHFLWKINSDGVIIKTMEIPNKYLYNHFEGMKISSNDDIFLYGSVVVRDPDPQNYFDDTDKLYMMKFNKELERKWEYEWYDFTGNNRSSIKELLFLDAQNFIVVGYKDYSNFYIARFKDSILTNASDDFIVNTDLKTYPNPTSDFLQIKSNYINGKIEIFSALGTKVLETKYKDRIDVGGLSTGVYFVKIDNRFLKFIKI